MKSRLLQWLGIFLILETGLLHIITAQAEYEEAAYIGYLFAANFFGALLAAYAIYHKQRWGWMLGLVIAVGSIVGYGFSRTTGMPGMDVEEWFNPYGVVAIAVEAGFILLAFFRPWDIPEGEPIDFTFKYPAVLPMIGLVLLSGISVGTVRWNDWVMSEYGHHVGTLAQVCKTPPISTAELEEKYGVQIALVASSMMDSIVDVRLKVVDPEKAHQLLQNQAALLVNQQALVLAPHMHSHTSGRLKQGKLFIIFFPSQANTIQAGTQVSLVFGSLRTEPVTVR